MRTSVLVVLILGIAGSTAHADDAIAFGEAGLKVGDAVLVSTPVSGAAYDPALDLIWFESKGTLQVIDLRDAKHKPIVIAKKFPDVGFTIEGASRAEWNSAYTPAFAYITVGKKSKIAAREGAYGPVDQDATDKLKKQIKKAKLVGKKFLAGLGKRAPRAVTVPTPAPAAQVQLPEGMCQSDDEGECGSAMTFGTTALELVTTQYSCGDACYLGCVLYDPRTKKFAGPMTTSTWGSDGEVGACDGYWFDSDGKTYVNGSVRCTLGKGVTCEEDPTVLYVGMAPKP